MEHWHGGAYIDCLCCSSGEGTYLHRVKNSLDWVRDGRKHTKSQVGSLSINRICSSICIVTYDNKFGTKRIIKLFFVLTF